MILLCDQTRSNWNILSAAKALISMSIKDVDVVSFINICLPSFAEMKCRVAVSTTKQDTLLDSSPAGHIYKLLATNNVIDESHDNGGYICCLRYLLSDGEVHCTLQAKHCLVSHV